MSPDPIQHTRPTILINGTASARLEAELLQLLVAEDADGLHYCEATFANWGDERGRPGYQHFGRDILDFGRTIAIAWNDRALFEGRISALEGEFPNGSAPVVRVRAEDRLIDLRMTRRTRSFDDMSTDGILRQLASDHGLTPDVDTGGPVFKHVAQLDQCDLAFARERCRTMGAEVWVDGTTLFARRRHERTGDRVALAYGNGLREVTVTADLAQQSTRLIVGGWSVPDKSEISETATASAISGETGGHETGASILASSFGERTHTVADVFPLNADDARDRAECLFRAAARRFVVARGVADPSATLRVGATATLQGIGALFDGDYEVIGTRHRFDSALGLRTEFTAERPWIG